MFLVIVCGSLISTLCMLFQGLLVNSSGLPIWEFNAALIVVSQRMKILCSYSGGFLNLQELRIGNLVSILLWRGECSLFLIHDKIISEVSRSDWIKVGNLPVEGWDTHIKMYFLWRKEIVTVESQANMFFGLKSETSKNVSTSNEGANTLLKYKWWTFLLLLKNELSFRVYKLEFVMKSCMRNW